jgi:hypothetical protein
MVEYWFDMGSKLAYPAEASVNVRLITVNEKLNTSFIMTLSFNFVV